MQTQYIVRFNDCDVLGHLNNSKYIDYMLNAREDHLRDFHQLELVQFHKQGFGWVVSNHEIQYLRPAFYNEKVAIESDLVDVGDSQLLVEIRMYNEAGNILKAILWTKFTCINIKTGKREQHPESFYEIALPIVNTGIDISNGLKGRISELMDALAVARN